MRKITKTKLLLLFFISMLFLCLVNASLNCEVDTSCKNTQLKIMTLTDTTNAHAADDTFSYSYDVCCDGVTGLAIVDSPGQVNNLVVSLTDTANAHAYTTSGHGHDIYLNATGRHIFCQYRTTDCDATEACVLELSDYDNAHVADCDSPYDLKVCCADIEEGLIITSLGLVGFPELSEDCTTSNAVILLLFFSQGSTKFRLSNENTVDWTAWQNPSTPYYWSLLDQEGLRRVYMQVNHSDGMVMNYSDTIYYNRTGACLLFNVPMLPIVVDDGDYTNINTLLHAYWYGACDPYAERLGLTLKYEYKIVNQTNSTIVDWTDAGSATEITKPVDLDEGGNYSFLVRVTNAKNLSNIVRSNGIVVDTVAPVMGTVQSTSHTKNEWTYDNNVSFAWSASDSNSGVKGYSYRLDKFSDNPPDIYTIKTGSGITYTNVPYGDGQYYFHIRAVDNANNWDNTVTEGWYGIDTSPPTKPVVLNDVKSADSNVLIFGWLPAQDDESGIADYLVNITDIDTEQLLVRQWLGSNETGFQANNATPGHNYMCGVISLNNAGLNSSSDLNADTVPPEILFKKPRGTIINSPILVLETDETASCYYNTSQGYALFEHTNDTFHESKLDLSPSIQEYNIEVKCYDTVGLSTSEIITFTYNASASPSSISVPQPQSYYVNVKSLLIVNTTPGIGEIPKSSFYVYVDEQEVSSNDFSIVDRGNGTYYIYFEPDSVGYSSVSVNVSVNSVVRSDELDIDIKDLTQVIAYVDEELSAPSNSKYIIYGGLRSTTFGLGGDGTNTETDPIPNGLNLSSRLDGNMYIIGTRGNSNLMSKENYLSSKTFSEFTNKFGYPIEADYLLRFYILKPNVGFSNDIVLEKGRHVLVVKNTGISGDKLMYEISEKRD